MTEKTMTETRSRWRSFRKDLLWPGIDDETSALDLARLGAVGGGCLVASLVVVLVLGHLFGDSLSAHAEPSQGYYLSQALRIALAGFLTWRVFRGEGRVASVVLLLWVLLAVSLKLASGELNVGWGLAWLFALLSLVHSVRGYRALGRLKPA
jgi:hypothetical protein